MRFARIERFRDPRPQGVPSRSLNQGHWDWIGITGVKTLVGNGLRPFPLTPALSRGRGGIVVRLTTKQRSR